MNNAIQTGNWKNGSFAILPNGGAFVSVEKYRTPTGLPTQPKENPNSSDFSEQYAWWGSDNMQPTRWREKLDKSTIGLSTIYKLIQMTYGQGLAWGYQVKNEDGTVTRKYDTNPDIADWMRKNRYKKYLAKRIVDFRFFGNVFSEFILSKDKSQINRVFAKEAEFVRLERQNPKNLQIENIGYCSYWANYTDDEVARLQLIDEWDEIQWIENNLKGWNFAKWSYFPSPGKIYYKYPFWGGLLREDGWLDVANDIPELISAMHKNQVKLRYHIKIPFEYWTMRYREWDTYSDEQRDKLMKAKFAEMDDYLLGKEATGKTFTSHFATDVNGKVVPGWEIVAVDDKFKQDAYIPNSQAADQQTVQTLGLDPSLMGLEGSTSSLGGSSGSDKRVSFFNQFALNTLEQEIILEDLNLVAEYNGWEGLEFWFEQTVPTRLDINPSGSQAV